MRKILELVRKIKNREINAFYLSFFLAGLLLVGVLLVDMTLLQRGISPMNAIGLPLTSALNMFYLFLIAILFACVFSIPLYYGIFLPRARLHILKLKKLAWQKDSDKFFQKLEEIRTLVDIFLVDDLDAFSDPMLNKKKLYQFLTNSLTSIKVKD